MGNKFDTAELNDIRRLLGEEIPKEPEKIAKPAPQTENSSSGGRSFNLDDILAEVSGVVDEAHAEYEAKRPENQTTARKPQTSARVAAQAQPSAQTPPASESFEMPAAASDKQGAQGLKQQEIRLPRRETKQERPAMPVYADDEEDDDDDDEIIAIQDPKKAMHEANRRAKNLGRRAIPVLILGLAALYLTMAEGLGLPMPEIISYAKNPRMFVLTQIGLQVLSMLIAIDIIGAGFYALITLKADRASLVAIANMAAVLHCMCFIIAGWGGVLPYSSICILLLYAAMREDKNRSAGRARAYKTATLHETPMGVYYHHDGIDHARRTVKSRMHGVREFLQELERPDSMERFARIYAPIMLVASIVLAVVAAVAQKNIQSFFWALSAMLTIACPLPILCAFGRAYYNVSRRLISEGAAIASGQAAFRVRKSCRAVIQDSDLFPSGTVSITEVRAHNGYTPEKLLSYAVAMTDGYDMEIGKLLAEALREQYGRPARASDIKVYDVGGLSGKIGGDLVEIGNAAYMARLGRPIQAPKQGHEVNTGIYVSINSQPAGVIELTYHSNPQTFNALQALLRLKVAPELATRDFNISPEMVQKMFETRRGKIGEVAADRIASVTSSAYIMGDRVCAILSRDGAVPFAQVHQSADKLSGAMRSNLILGAVGGVCGLLLMFYLAFVGHPEAVTPKNVLLYLIFWYIPSFFVTFNTRKGL